MSLTPESIEKFRRLWQEQYGEELSPEQARHEAETLLRSVHWILMTAARLERQATEKK